MRTTIMKPLLALAVLLLSAPLYADPGHGHGNGNGHGHGHGHQGSGKNRQGEARAQEEGARFDLATATRVGWRSRTG
ncbi:hypothetical protein HA44_15860 [Mixta gaviniae]|nr:hypothetical protein HA44_15860 [Mixta gaviniae]